MNGSGETRWMDDPELPSQILSTPIVPTPDTVTITISREAAKKVADWPDDERYPFSAELGKAARAALEGER